MMNGLKSILSYFYLTVAFTMLLFIPRVSAQYSGSFVVQGDLGKYYPVVFHDAAWNNNQATEFDIGRSNVHTDASWRGSLIAHFRVHTTDWGHGSNFIDANIRQYNGANSNIFVAGWRDATAFNGDQVIIVWLQGGTTTYYYNSASNISPIIYDGVQNPATYQETNGPALSYKTGPDITVNSYGLNSGGTAYFSGSGTNYFLGVVGIGTTSPGNYKLAVNGGIHSQSVNVDLTGWSDYVFKKDYTLPSLTEVKTYIDQNHHLPDMPSEQEVVKNGINLGEMNKLLTKKVEELTLYLIEQKEEQQKVQKQQEDKINRLEAALQQLLKSK